MIGLLNTIRAQFEAARRRRNLCKSWHRTAIPHGATLPVRRNQPPAATLIPTVGPRGGTPTYTSPLHYESIGDGSPGISFDLNYNPGVGNIHTLLSIDVTCDVGSPYNHINIRHPDGTEWVSPAIPPGTGHFTQAQINGQGFTILEDCQSFTASY